MRIIGMTRRRNNVSWLAKFQNWRTALSVLYATGASQAGDEAVSPLEFVFERPGPKVLAQVLQPLHVERKGAVNVLAVGHDDVAPQLVGRAGQARHVAQAAAGDFPRVGPAQLIDQHRG